jgi:hypothetical protein
MDRRNVNELWDIVQGVGALAGIIALFGQGWGVWKRRHVPRNVDALRLVLDTAYHHLIPLKSRVSSGTGSLEMVEDSDAVTACIDLVRHANRLADPVLSSAVREAGLSYHLTYAFGANLNVPRGQRDQALVKQQLDAASQSLDAIQRAYSRLDEMERRARS